MNEQTWKLLRDILRFSLDAFLVALGIFMLAHETLTSSTPDPLIVGAALALVGLPGAFTLDRRRRDSNGNDS